jgi:Chaperone of endosialidase
MNLLIQLKRESHQLSLVGLVLICFALASPAQAVVPPPDGGYPNFTTAEGTKALQNLTTGAGNTGLGWYSLFGDMTGSFNTGVGAGTLALNTADQNTATGAGALLLNTDGMQNTANGALALLHNDTGSFNTAIGGSALLNNITGLGNTAIGFESLLTNTTGGFNTAVGNGALHNTTASRNTGIGTGALAANTTGERNTAIGFQALISSMGTDNTACGDQALTSNTTGDFNVAMGSQALATNTEGFHNVAIGTAALANNTTGSANTAVGPATGLGITTADNVIAIHAAGANITGSCFIGNIRGVTTAVADAIPVVIDSAHQLGTQSSSRRFKKEIRPMDNTSEAILALKPVTFHYKNDNKNIAQFGLVAEEVAEINPDLVVRDQDGKIYTVRYDAINAMLLNEFLKEHRTVQEQGAMIARQQKQIDALTAGLQKVSAQVELSKSAPQTVVNNQ